jgi:hypothetical protein
MSADLLDVTSDDVALLDDKQLRKLIARLCEAEVERQGKPRTTVIWGGHQDSKDGGVDVRVELPPDPAWCGNIPRPVTIFQSKNSKMAPAAIREEMRFKGVLRPSIIDVLARGGAYVIVSNCESHGVADGFLQERKAAMEDAVRPDFPEHQGVLDFYDSSRLASWVRSHPEVVLWLRSAIGKPLQGWKSWKQLQSVHGTDFLLDESLRLRVPNISEDAGMSLLEGISALRNALRPEGVCVRLAGLSGVGKTRLVQALFEMNVGTDALASRDMIYADISDEPIPLPLELCRQLHARNSSSVIVVDNCPPELHRKLTEFVTGSSCRLRLLTVEYDVREDEPEETSVFHLEPASDELIERLIGMRFPELQVTDPKVIADFAGGNARVAIALAKTVRKGERLTGLKDTELFRRLFHQRHEKSDQLLQVARCCSLLYSFQLEAKDSDFSSELLVLAELAGIEPGAFFSQVQELKQRDLLQRRSIWAAILPHAIANQLAKEALKRFPEAHILRLFRAEGRERMLKSFARRLGYLNDSKEAKAIVWEWLAPNGMLGKLEDLDTERISWFERVAPIAETQALDAYERALISSNPDAQVSYLPFRQAAERLLQHLAYLPENFAKAVDLLRVLTASYSDAKTAKAVLDRYKALFALRFSGTMAPPDAKLSYLRKFFLEAVTDHDRIIAVALLECGLEIPMYLYHPHISDFGSRTGAMGYVAQSDEEFFQWYHDLLDFTTRQILSNSWSSAQLKGVLAKLFRRLWECEELKDDLERASGRLNEEQGWIEGYNAVRSTIHHARKHGGARYSAEDVERLRSLKARLLPQDLNSRVRLIVSPGYRIPFEDADDMDGDISLNLAKVEASITDELMEVGRMLAEDRGALERLLPELLDPKFPKVHGLMQGVMSGVEDVQEFWSWLEARFAELDPQNPNANLVLGIVRSLLERDPAFTFSVLDHMPEHSNLGRIFPLVQIWLPFDPEAYRRLIRSAKLGLASIYDFQYLGHGRRHEALDDGSLVEVLEAIGEQKDGLEVALEILGMRFHGLSEGSYCPSAVIVRFTHRFLTELLPLDSVHDYKISTLIPVAFEGRDSCEEAAAFARRLAEFQNESWNARNLTQTFAALGRLQPQSLLDGYLMHLDAERGIRPGYSESPSHPSGIHSEDPFREISDELMAEWCGMDQEVRQCRLARFVRLYRYDPQAQRVAWRDFVMQMIIESKRPLLLLEDIYQGFCSGHWSGSYADIMSHYLPLLRDLEVLERDDIAEWAAVKMDLLTQEIADWREQHENRNASELRGFE